MISTAVRVLVVLLAVASTLAANIKYPILPVNNSHSMAAEQWNTRDAEGQINFGYAYNGQAATNVLNADGHMVGAWSYLNPQGALVQTSYTAHEKGFIPSIVLPSGVHYPTAAYPLMVLANTTFWMPTQKPSSSTQLETVVPTNTKTGFGVGPAKILGLVDYRIVGGWVAGPGIFHGMVALKKSGQFKCGGILIGPNKVLTAANCFESLVPLNVGRHYTVELGANVLSPSSGQLSRIVSRVEIHKDYDPVTWSNDIAILTLRSPVIYSQNIFPFSLPPANTNEGFVGQDAAIIGWGSIFDHLGPKPSTLQFGQVKIISNDICRQLLFNVNQPIWKTMICATGQNSGSCNGDEGGPLLVRSSNSEPYTAIGIASVKRGGCLLFSSPAIYTRLSSFSQWISDRI